MIIVRRHVYVAGEYGQRVATLTDETSVHV
jgi:hypothetical protein